MDGRVEFWLAMMVFAQFSLTFFLHMQVTIKEKQFKWLILVSGAYSVIMMKLICMPGGGLQFLLASLCELTWLNAIFYLFTEHLVLSVVRASVVSWTANGLSFMVLHAVDPEGCELFSSKQLTELSWKSAAVFCLCVAVFTILQYPVTQLVFRYRPRLDRLYIVIGVIYYLFLILQTVLGYRSAEEGEYADKNYLRGGVAALIVLLIILVLVWVRHQSLKLQKMQLQNRMDTLNRQYEEIAERNRELYFVRHELGKQAEAMRRVGSHVPEETRKKWVQSLEEQLHCSLSGLSLSGNLMLDTLIEKKKREYAESGRILETILMPVRIGRRSEEMVAMVQEELFRYADRFRHAGGWVRYNLRFRGRMAFLVMEIDIGRPIQYHRNRLLNLIGDRWAVRRAFAQTYAVAAEYDGCVDYELKREQAVIGVMLRLPEESV